MGIWDKIKGAAERTANFVTGGRNDRQRSERIVRWAKEDEEDAKQRIEEARLGSKRVMDHLGELRLAVYNTTVKEFVELYEQIARVSVTEFKGVDETIDQPQSSIDIRELKAVSLHAQQIMLGGGAGALGGATLAFGAWGLAGVIGTASTGTAIGTLSGVAATNATLAWLGGGAVSAGGLGVTGGAAVLGGLAVIPAAVVAMYFGQNQAKQKLNEARNFRDNVEVFVAEINSYIAQLAEVNKGAQLLNEVITSLDSVVKTQNGKMKKAIHQTVGEVERLQNVLAFELVAPDGTLQTGAASPRLALPTVH